MTQDVLGATSGSIQALLICIFGMATGDLSLLETLRITRPHASPTEADLTRPFTGHSGSSRHRSPYTDQRVLNALCLCSGTIGHQPR